MKTKAAFSLFKLAFILIAFLPLVSIAQVINVPGGEPATFHDMRYFYNGGASFYSTTKYDLGKGDFTGSSGVYIIQTEIDVEGPQSVSSYMYTGGGNELWINVHTIPWGGTTTQPNANYLKWGAEQVMLYASGGIVEFDLGYTLSIYADTDPCKKFTISYRVLNSAQAVVIPWKRIDIYPFRHGNDALFTPDIFLRDNINDQGYEPLPQDVWNNDAALITKSPDIWNGYPQQSLSNNHLNPMHSIRTPPNANALLTKILGRSCIAAPSEAYIYQYWTIARLWEPWAHDWLNWQANATVSGTANTSFPLPNKVTYQGTDRPLGNPITMGPYADYNHTPVGYNVGTPPAKMSLTLSRDWIVPDPLWYFSQASFPIQYAAANGNPVICFLVRIEEPWKTNNGFYSTPVITENGPDNQILSYVSKNNNVATRNAHILNSVGGYMIQPTQNGDYYGTSGVVMINNPLAIKKLNISIANIDQSGEAFDVTAHAQINLYLDELLWDRWVAAGSYGHNIEVVDDQVIRVTSNTFATLDSISLDSNETSWIALEAQYYTNSPPDTDYVFSFVLGPYLDLPTMRTGSPTHFDGVVLSDPRISTDSNDYFQDPEPPDAFTNVSQITSDKLHLTVYPNPSSNLTFVNFTLVDGGYVSMHIYDLTGKCIKVLDTNGTPGRNNLQLDLSEFGDGTFILHFQPDETQAYSKFVVSK